MSKKLDRFKVGEEYDRRRKLTQEQKEQILEIYKQGGITMTDLGKQFGVTRHTRAIIVKPERAKAVAERVKERWQDYYDTEKHSKEMQKHRQYKRKLMNEKEKGKI